MNPYRKLFSHQGNVNDNFAFFIVQSIPLKFLKEEFLLYFKQWEKSGKSLKRECFLAKTLWKGKLHQKGSINDNATVAEAIKSTETIRIVDGIWLDNITGYCRGEKTEFQHDMPNQPFCKGRKVNN